MSRVRIWTAPRSIAEMAAAELQGEGLPVTTHFTELETEMYPNALVELWLEDEDLLQDESVRQRIDDITAEHPLNPSEEEQAASMPFQDVPERPLVRSKWPVIFVVIAILALIAAAVWISSSR